MTRPIMSDRDFAKLGGGEVGYVKFLTAARARELFPSVEGLPPGIDIYLLAAADGTPIALTDTKQAAIGHAISDELVLQSLH